MYHCILSTNAMDPAKLKKEYLEWWQRDGRSFVMQASGACGGQAASSESLGDESEDAAMEDDVDLEVLEDMGTTEALQARDNSNTHCGRVSRASASCISGVAPVFPMFTPHGPTALRPDPSDRHETAVTQFQKIQAIEPRWQ